MLEIADRDFREIRDRSRAYGERVAAEIGRNETTRIKLDSVSYKAFVASSQLVNQLDEFAAQFSGLPAGPDDDPDITVGCLRFVGIETIEELQRALEDNKEFLKRYTATMFTDGSHKAPFPFAEAISLFHLPQILAARSGGKDLLAQMYRAFLIGNPSAALESAAETASVVEKLDEDFAG